MARSPSKSSPAATTIKHPRFYGPRSYADALLRGKPKAEQRGLNERRITLLLSRTIGQPPASAYPPSLQVYCIGAGHNVVPTLHIVTTDQNLGSWAYFCHSERRLKFVTHRIDPELHPDAEQLRTWLEIRKELKPIPRASVGTGAGMAPTQVITTTPSATALLSTTSTGLGSIAQPDNSSSITPHTSGNTLDTASMPPLIEISDDDKSDSEPEAETPPTTAPAVQVQVRRIRIKNSNGMPFIAPDISRKDVHGALTKFLDEHTRPANNSEPATTTNDHAELVPPATVEKNDNQDKQDSNKVGGEDAGKPSSDEDGGEEEEDGSEFGDGGEVEEGGVVEEDGGVVEDHSDDDGGKIEEQGKGENGRKGDGDDDDDEEGDGSKVPHRTRRAFPKSKTAPKPKGPNKSTTTFSKKTTTSKSKARQVPSNPSAKTTNKRRAIEAPTPSGQPKKKKARVEATKDTSGGMRKSTRTSSRPSKYPS
ncbi:hypothetical protein BDN72DRAFT_865253 [Pluteus cervinus]|uniref:Uncharacterized protein n=1 Tax=Pluteus cervinus TaxID=181527 RepID=A0ACD3A106_9AGAR|nr:hypothetical protein BDN72DRAFT_865253 [Pluteus cervinus]